MHDETRKGRLSQVSLFIYFLSRPEGPSFCSCKNNVANLHNGVQWDSQVETDGATKVGQEGTNF